MADPLIAKWKENCGIANRIAKGNFSVRVEKLDDGTDENVVIISVDNREVGEIRKVGSTSKGNGWIPRSVRFLTIMGYEVACFHDYGDGPFEEVTLNSYGCDDEELLIRHRMTMLITDAVRDLDFEDSDLEN